MTVVHVLVPDGIDDPAGPSGGNTYDRRICRGLGALGWMVRERAVAGSWPRPDDSALEALRSVLAAVPDDGVVLIDGLIASPAAGVLGPEARRLRLVVLVHMPTGGQAHGDLADGPESERAALAAARAIVTPSYWTRNWLIDRYALQANIIQVAEPGVDAAGLAAGTPSGAALVCVAALAPHKGHDVLVDALSTLTDLRWCCRFVGSLDRDRAFVNRLVNRAREHGIADRIQLTGPRTGADLDAVYTSADLLVLASHGETYGMVVTEALARGLPVVATAVGGLPEALGTGADGTVPGLLVPAADPTAFATALRRWLSDPDLRRQLRTTAEQRRATLPRWSDTAGRIAEVLAAVAA